MGAKFVIKEAGQSFRTCLNVGLTKGVDRSSCKGGSGNHPGKFFFENTVCYGITKVIGKDRMKITISETNCRVKREKPEMDCGARAQII